jgi:hypothetical protein
MSCINQEASSSFSHTFIQFPSLLNVEIRLGDFSELTPSHDGVPITLAITLEEPVRMF